ncbi:MAG: hypothetical protein QOJ20_1904, partial [Mycobacterium sp.]|nr:hypothetical protein [Mycobacterium sp.]
MRWNDWVYRWRACSNRSGWTRREPCTPAAQAANAALSAAVGTKLPLMPYRIPDIRFIEDAVYRWTPETGHHCWSRSLVKFCDRRGLTSAGVSFHL